MYSSQYNCKFDHEFTSSLVHLLVHLLLLVHLCSPLSPPMVLAMFLPFDSFVHPTKLGRNPRHGRSEQLGASPDGYTSRGRAELPVVPLVPWSVPGVAPGSSSVLWVLNQHLIDRKNPILREGWAHLALTMKRWEKSGRRGTYLVTMRLRPQI